MTEATTADATEATADDSVINILQIDSNHEEFAWSQEIHRGIVDALAEAGYSAEAGNLAIEVRYMDTKRQTSQEYFDQIGAELTAYITETQPDLVIANDDNAARLVVQPLKDGDIPFVLLGVNGTPGAVRVRCRLQRLRHSGAPAYRRNDDLDRRGLRRRHEDHHPGGRQPDLGSHVRRRHRR
ncbi:MAG: hypothetical protein IPK19_25875 [Chloroflexi bacterium]|nr:hypothetical protein [Chloroflexota bacterium]